MKLHRIVFMGTPDFAVPALEALVEAGYEVAGVFTQPDRPKGRSGKIAAPPVKEAALRLGLPVYQSARIREKESVDILRGLSPDAIVVAAFGQIIPKEILDMPPFGCINVHGSLLPKYRGAAPIQWAVIDGEAKSGVTIMQMDEGIDTGDMLLKQERDLDPDETGGSLFEKLRSDGASALIRALKGLEEGTIVPEKQPEKSPTPYAAVLSKKSGLIDWTCGAAAIERLVRGLNPWPTAYTTLDGKQLKIWKAAVIGTPGEGEGAPGGAYRPGCVAYVGKTFFDVQTGDGVLRILELQLEGKKRMETEAFLRGFRLEEGRMLADA